MPGYVHLMPLLPGKAHRRFQEEREIVLEGAVGVAQPERCPREIGKPDGLRVTPEVHDQVVAPLKKFYPAPEVVKGPLRPAFHAARLLSAEPVDVVIDDALDERVGGSQDGVRGACQKVHPRIRRALLQCPVTGGGPDVIAYQVELDYKRPGKTA